ncbi:MAG TPA: DUF4412 domain-containing protein [Parafilimonas sp.]|nr:DUF4412 domain-containing protein [Parafilimonas sp.]
MKAFLPVRFSLKYLFMVLLITMSLLTCKIAYAQDTKDFKFKLGITYDVSSGGGESHKLAMWVSEDVYTGMEPTEGNSGVFIIFNMKDMKMLTVMQAQKSVMIMDLNKYQKMAQQNQSTGDKTATQAQITKTGVTEKILGYNCDQYKVSSEKSESLIWVTTELGSGFSDFAKSLMMALNNGRGKTQGATIPDMQGAGGVMLKMEATDLSTKKVTKMEATQVNKDGKEVNITDYNVMSM